MTMMDMGSNPVGGNFWVFLKKDLNFGSKVFRAIPEMKKNCKNCKNEGI